MRTHHDGIRQRREERINRLLRGESLHADRRTAFISPVPGPMENRETGRSVDRESDDDFSAGRRPLEEPPYPDSRWNDPEYAWKQQNRHRWEDDKDGFRWPRSFFHRLLVSALIYAVLFVVFQVNQPWAVRGKEWVAAGLSRSVNYTAVAAWYHRWFEDAPSWLPAFHPDGDSSAKVGALPDSFFLPPVAGKVTHPYDAGGDGSHSLGIATSSGAPIHAMADGLVTFAGMREGEGLAVVIQHADGYQTVYGQLQKSDVFMNDWVKQGSTIGIAGIGQDGGTLSLSVLKNGNYINPADVVSFD